MEFTNQQLRERFGVEVIAIKKVNDKEYEVTVKKMPAFPIGCEAKFRWVEVDVDPTSLEAIQEWRDAYVEKYGAMDPGCFPDPHGTLQFDYCPVADADVMELAESVLKIKEPAFYDTIVALGPPGKEDCWAVETEHTELRHAMLEAKINPRLNCNHPLYVPKDGWVKSGGDFPSVKAHITLVRRLTPEQMRERGTPILTHPFKVRFTRVREWVGVKDANGIAFKFTRTHRLEHVIS